MYCKIFAIGLMCMIFLALSLTPFFIIFAIIFIIMDYLGYSIDKNNEMIAIEHFKEFDKIQKEREEKENLKRKLVEYLNKPSGNEMGRKVSAYDEMGLNKKPMQDSDRELARQTSHQIKALNKEIK